MEPCYKNPPRSRCWPRNKTVTQTAIPTAILTDTPTAILTGTQTATVRSPPRAPRLRWERVSLCLDGVTKTEARWLWRRTTRLVSGLSSTSAAETAVQVTPSKRKKKQGSLAALWVGLKVGTNDCTTRGVGWWSTRWRYGFTGGGWK